LARTITSCCARTCGTLEYRKSHWGLLTRPLLYLSLFLKMHRQEYYRRLSAAREEGDWEGWLAFFLEGIATVADEAVATARRLHVIVGNSRDRLLARDDATVFSLRLFELLPEHPILTVNRLIERLDCSRPAAGKAVRVLEAAGIVRPKGERKKNRTVVFEDYLAHLRQRSESGSPRGSGETRALSTRAPRPVVADAASRGSPGLTAC
jgi:hypothetical protein